MWKKKPAYPGLIKNGREKVQNVESYCTYICNVIEASWISKRLFEWKLIEDVNDGWWHYSTLKYIKVSEAFKIILNLSFINYIHYVS